MVFSFGQHFETICRVAEKWIPGTLRKEQENPLPRRPKERGALALTWTFKTVKTSSAPAATCTWRVLWEGCRSPGRLKKCFGIVPLRGPQTSWHVGLASLLGSRVTGGSCACWERVVWTGSGSENLPSPASEEHTSLGCTYTTCLSRGTSSTTWVWPLVPSS